MESTVWAEHSGTSSSVVLEKAEYVDWWSCKCILCRDLWKSRLCSRSYCGSECWHRIMPCHFNFAHGNPPAHAPLFIQQYLGKDKLTIVYHPPYSPNMAPTISYCVQSWRNPWNKVVFKQYRRFSRILYKSCYKSWKNILIILYLLFWLYNEQ